MAGAKNRAELFELLGLGPVWELKSRQTGLAATPLQPAAEVTPPSESAAPTLTSDMPSLEELSDQVAGCRACGLCETRTQTVFADGTPHASLMVVGEAPGADEDATGLPFVGRAGQLLDRMLAAVNASRSRNVYIANVLKCRPPGNRNPEPVEIERCSTYLMQQITLNQPKVLLLVGRFAIQTLLQTQKNVGELRGKIHRVTVNGREIPAIVTYHPAYLLRRPEEKAKAWDDLLLLLKHGF